MNVGHLAEEELASQRQAYPVCRLRRLLGSAFGLTVADYWKVDRNKQTTTSINRVGHNVQAALFSCREYTKIISRMI